MNLDPGFVLSLALVTAGLTLYFFIKANHTERMAQIERGHFDDGQPPVHRSFFEVKLGMLLSGLGLGLLFSLGLERLSILTDTDVLYPAFMFLFGGLSLVGSYFLVDRLRRKQ